MQKSTRHPLRGCNRAEVVKIQANCDYDLREQFDELEVVKFLFKDNDADNQLYLQALGPNFMRRLLQEE